MNSERYEIEKTIYGMYAGTYCIYDSFEEKYLVENITKDESQIIVDILNNKGK